ncbi:hypothetical protein K8T06_03175 [bacterium]|nr:hypothetical protein [bacterium]
MARPTPTEYVIYTSEIKIGKKRFAICSDIEPVAEIAAIRVIGAHFDQKICLLNQVDTYIETLTH